MGGLGWILLDGAPVPCTDPTMQPGRASHHPPGAPLIARWTRRHVFIGAASRGGR